MNTSSLIEGVRVHFPDAVSASHACRGDATVVVVPKYLLEVARFLKEDPALKMNSETSMLPSAPGPFLHRLVKSMPRICRDSVTWARSRLR